MTNYIRVSNLENNTVWQKQLSDKEYHPVSGFTRSEHTIAIIPATLKPVRTNNLKNFSKDFFLPTTINHAIKAHHIACKFFAILPALALDGITLPIRFLTCVPRIWSNAGKEVHPLKKYLINESVDKKLLESDHVRVRLGWKSNWLEHNVNFIEVPIYKGSDYWENGTVSTSTSNF